jgi:hypothetical protein
MPPSTRPRPPRGYEQRAECRRLRARRRGRACSGAVDPSWPRFASAARSLQVTIPVGLVLPASGNPDTRDPFAFVRPATSRSPERPILQVLSFARLGGSGPRRESRCPIDNTTCLFAGTSRDGSDGTRTRDLRRDKPSQLRRRPTTIPSVRPHLQALFAPRMPALRMVEPIVRSTFGPRVGHENLS